VSVEVTSFGPERECPPLVAGLHASLLPGNRLTGAGGLFLERFYYLELPRDGAIVGAFAVADGRPAGFVTVTRDPDRYLEEAVRRYPGQFTAVAIVSLLRRPVASVSAWRRIRRGSGPGSSPRADGTGELLALAVLPELRGPRDDLDRRSLAHALVARAVLRLRDAGLGAIRVVVDPGDARSARFFAREGWTRTERAPAAGLSGPEEWRLDWGRLPRPRKVTSPG
jgi:ribosomal protein S18 acetylase RimI-like enzyme